MWEREICPNSQVSIAVIILLSMEQFPWKQKTSSPVVVEAHQADPVNGQDLVSGTQPVAPGCGESGNTGTN